MPSAQALSLNEIQQQQKKAAEDAKKFRELQAQKEKEATTYEEQIERTEKQIVTVENSLSETQRQISDKKTRIAGTIEEIKDKEDKLATLKKQQNQAVVTLYEFGNPTTAEMVAGAKSLSEYADRLANIEGLEYQLIETQEQVAKLKQELEDKKAGLEKEKGELDGLKGQQEAQQRGLESEKERKDYLKEQAEKKAETYEQLAEQAEKKKQEFDRQLAAALAASRKGGGSVVTKGRVSRGQVIGYEGTTGFSTGPHLHWSVIKDGNYVNPRGYVGGRLQWPMTSFSVSQEFGPAGWKNSVYSFHNGIDLVGSSGSGTPVMAAADGNIIEPFPNYNGWMPGGYGHYVVIDHGDGIWTLYGHLIR